MIPFPYMALNFYAALRDIMLLHKTVNGVKAHIVACSSYCFPGFPKPAIKYIKTPQL